MPVSESDALRSYREAAFPAESTPWREVTFTVLDFETTGLDPTSDEIISFGCVTVAGGRVRLDDARYELIRPKRMPDWDTIRIHGLREIDLEEAPSLAEVLNDLLGALTARVLVAHVAAVERGFLRAALATVDDTLRNPVVDTAELGRELRRLRREPPLARAPGGHAGPAISSPGLSDLARSLGLPVHRPHEADGDALTTAQVFIALATHLDAFEAQTIGSLERASREHGRRPWFRRILDRLGVRPREGGG